MPEVITRNNLYFKAVPSNVINMALRRFVPHPKTPINLTFFRLPEGALDEIDTLPPRVDHICLEHTVVSAKACEFLSTQQIGSLTYHIDYDEHVLATQELGRLLSLNTNITKFFFKSPMYHDSAHLIPFYLWLNAPQLQELSLVCSTRFLFRFETTLNNMKGLTSLWLSENLILPNFSLPALTHISYLTVDARNASILYTLNPNNTLQQLSLGFYCETPEHMIALANLISCSTNLVDLKIEFVTYVFEYLPIVMDVIANSKLLRCSATFYGHHTERWSRAYILFYAAVLKSDTIEEVEPPIPADSIKSLALFNHLEYNRLKRVSLLSLCSEVLIKHKFDNKLLAL